MSAVLHQHFSRIDVIKSGASKLIQSEKYRRKIHQSSLTRVETGHMNIVSKQF